MQIDQVPQEIYNFIDEYMHIDFFIAKVRKTTRINEPMVDYVDVMYPILTEDEAYDDALVSYTDERTTDVCMGRILLNLGTHNVSLEKTRTFTQEGWEWDRSHDTFTYKVYAACSQCKYIFKANRINYTCQTCIEVNTWGLIAQRLQFDRHVKRMISEMI